MCSQTAPSESLQCHRTRGVAVISESCAGIQSDLGSWADRNLMEFNERRCRALHPLGAPIWKAALQKRSTWWTPRWTQAGNVSLYQRGLMVFLAALGKMMSANGERQSFPLCSALVRSHLEFWVQFWAHSIGETWTYWGESSEELQRWERGSSLTSHMRKCWVS